MTATRPERLPSSPAEREAALQRKIGDLTAALDAIRSGGIDAVRVPAREGERLYTLTSADRPYRTIVEEMGDGVATISQGGIVLYANRRLAELARRDRSSLLGLDVGLVVRTHSGDLPALAATPLGATDFAEVELVRPDGSTIPALASITGLDLDGVVVRCLVVTDLSGRAEAEDRFRATMDSAMTGMALLSPQGRFILVNPALCQMLSRDTERLMTLAWPEVTHPDDVEPDRGLLEQLAAGTVPSFRTRTRYVRPDGSVLWGDVAVSCVRHDDRSVKYFIAQITDVTEAVQAERELMRREAELQTIAAGSADILVKTSPDRRVEYVSPAITRVLGWEPEEILGRDASEFLHPDDLAGSTALRESGEVLPRRARLRCKDGSYRWMGTTATPLGDPAAPAGVVAVVRDVDDLVRTERALVESERHYRSLVEGAAEALFESGPDHRLSWVSPAVTALLGWTPDELVGAAMADLLDPEDRQHTAADRTAAVSGQPTAQRHAVRIRSKSGEHRWVSIWVDPVVDESGILLRTVGGIQDIHDLVTTRARLRATLDTEFDPHVVLEAVRDPGGRIVDFVYTDANPAACEYNGVAYRDLVGARLLDLLPGHLHSEIMEMYANVVETGQPLRVDNFVYENELRGGEARRYDVQAAKLGDGLSYTWRDVTDRFATAEALAQSEEIHRLLMENLSDVVVHLCDGVVTWVTPSLTATLGWEPEDWLGHAVVDFVEPDEPPAVDKFRASGDRGDVNLFRTRMRAKAGTVHWIQVQAKPYVDQNGNQDGVVASFRIIDPEMAAEADLEARARSDELTGLMNRREVLERVAVLTSHPRRSGEEAAVLFGDVDGFKSINDRYGHSAGDEVLHTVAARVSACLRAGDLAARIGGDELLVLLDGVHELANAVDIADNIRRAVAQPIDADGHTLTATLSIGVTLAVPGEDVDDMIARADEAMYEAKQAGGDRVVSKLPFSP